MWIVKLALRRPYTFVVLSILILVMGGVAIFRTPTDIFPNINIPVIAVIWRYEGLSAQDFADRITTNFERNLTTTVNDIEHMESTSLRSISVIKVFFQPGAKVEMAMAQISASAQSAIRQMPHSPSSRIATLIRRMSTDIILA